jgi:hypothetical protein
MISLLVTRTLWIRGSLLATVLMPRLHDLRVVYPDQPSDATQLPGVESVIPRQPQRLQPELARLALALDVNVRRFDAIEARKEQSVGTRDSTHPRHSSLRTGPASNALALSGRRAIACEKSRSSMPARSSASLN